MTINKHILVVEDEAPVRFIVGRTLSDAGYVVSEAADDRQAKLMLMSANHNHVQFDLILLDIGMPTIGGDVLFDELVQIDACPPILLMTREISDSKPTMINDRHCVGMIVKPWDPTILRESVAGIFAVLSGEMQE